jgi:hypothetical protein
MDLETPHQPRRNKTWRSCPGRKVFLKSARLCCATRTQLRPIESRRDHSRLNCAIHPRLQKDFSPEVEHPHRLSVGNATGAGVGGMHLQKVDFFHLLHGRLVGEKSNSGSCQPCAPEVPAGKFFSAPMARFRRRLELGNGIEAQCFHGFAVQFGLARGSAEVAVGEGKKRSRRTGLIRSFLESEPGRAGEIAAKFSRTWPSRSSRSRVMPCSHGFFEDKRAIDHLVDAFAEALVGESHARGEGAE